MTVENGPVHRAGPIVVTPPSDLLRARSDGKGTIIGTLGIEFQPHDAGPFAFGVTANPPVRHDDDRLMDQFKTAFGLAHTRDRISPDVCALVG